MRSCLTLIVGAVVLMIGAWLALPPYSVDPLCTYDVIWRETAVIEAGGKRYTATKTSQDSHSRSWVSEINAGGCQQKAGRILPYRLDDDRVILLRGQLCPAAKAIVANGQTADIVAACQDDRRRTNDPRLPDLFVVTTASQPTTWEGYKVDDRTSGVRVVQWTASPSLRAPHDDLAKVAPALMKVDYGESPKWGVTPGPFIARPHSFFGSRAADHIVVAK